MMSSSINSLIHIIVALNYYTLYRVSREIIDIKVLVDDENLYLSLRNYLRYVLALVIAGPVWLVWMSLLEDFWLARLYLDLAPCGLTG